MGKREAAARGRRVYNSEAQARRVAAAVGSGGGPWVGGGGGPVGEGGVDVEGAGQLGQLGVRAVFQITPDSWITIHKGCRGL